MNLEMCNYCKQIETYRKTDKIPKCAVCEMPLIKNEVMITQ